MSFTATINDQQFTVTPRNRLEALATRPAALRYSGSAIIAAAFAVLGTGYSLISSSVLPPGGDARGALVGLAISMLALTVGVVIHRRLQSLLRSPEAWAALPTTGQGDTPAPWRTVLHVPRRAVFVVVVVAVLWVPGTLLQQSSAGTAQMLGGAAMLPGVALLLLGNATCVWVAFSALIYMLWSLMPPGGAHDAASEDPQQGKRRS